jgi:uncharacterized protein YbjT (DUF2867 family)
MMPKQSVLLLGATGETGKSVLDGLLEDGSFVSSPSRIPSPGLISRLTLQDIKLLIRAPSLEKPAVQEFKKQGLNVVVGDPSEGAQSLVPLLKGVDTVISTIDATHLDQELPLIEAAKTAGVKRFVPCAFATPCPSGGVMFLRDLKERNYQAIWQAHLPYTIIDVGFWHQISLFTLPSGKADYAAILRPSETVTGDGNKLNLLTDQRDVGRFVARIIKDERTLNKWVYTWGDILTQNEIVKLEEELSGEKIKTQHVRSPYLPQGVEHHGLASI